MLIIADGDRAFRARALDQLNRPPDVIEVDQVRQVSGVLAERVSGSCVVLLGPHIKAAAAFAFATQVMETTPEVSVLLVSASLDADLLAEAMRAGIRDVLPNSFSPAQLKAAIARAELVSRAVRDRTAGPALIDITDHTPHSVITVISSKGGVGKSMVSSNIAILLAQRGHDVALVDLDLSSGDLGVMLKLFPARTLFDAVHDLDRLDDESLKGYLLQHPSKVWLLGAPQEPGDSEAISAESVQAILRRLKKSYRYVVVDTPPMFNDQVLAAIDESDLLLTVTTMDVPSIKNVRVALQTLDMLGVPRERIRMVLNRADSKVGLNIPEVEKTLGTKVDVAVPSSREVPLSINRGIAITEDQPKSPVSIALGRLVDSLTASTTDRLKNTNTNRRFHVGRKR
jgi:pilus assembly protein CpaE